MVANTETNCFVQLKSDNLSLSPIWCRMGMFYYGKTAQCGLRFDRDYAGNYFSSFRNVSTFGDFSAAFCGILKLDQANFGLQKLDTVLSYKAGDVNLSLTHNVQTNQSADKKSYNNVTFGKGKVQAGASYKHSKDLNLAFNVNAKSLQGDAKKVRAVVGAEAKVNADLTVKAKVDQKAKLSTSFLYKLDERVSLVAAA